MYEEVEMYIILILTAISLLIFHLINKITNINRKFPPGPVGLPILGFLPFLGSVPYKKLRDLGYKYGNIVGLQLGSKDVVILNDYQAMKEAYTNPDILDRVSNLFDFHAGGLGFAGGNGVLWLEERRCSMKIVKEMGVDKSKWEEILDPEIEILTKNLSKQNGEPFDPHDLVSESIASNMLSLFLGKEHMSSQCKELKIVVKASDAIPPLLNQSGWSNYFPFLSILIAKFGFARLHQEIINTENFNKLIKEKVEERKNSRDIGQEKFIDLYLRQMQLQEGQNMQFPLSEYNLTGNVQALIHGGSETVRTSLLWLLLAMASHPVIQDKIHKEIDHVLDAETLCQWADRNKLPYTYATVLEGQRWRTTTPLGLSHKASADTSLSGYKIPKGTYVIANMWAIHNDTYYWSDPENFLPDRFLSQETESFVPFSIGRRKCPGDKMALMEIFKYFTTIIQNFEILPLEDCPPNLEGIPEVTYHPQSQKLRFVPRKQMKI